MKRWWMGVGVVALWAGMAQAAPPPAEVFFGEADIREAVLSPSGTQLAVTTGLGTKRVSLVVFDLAPGGKARRIVHYNDSDVVNVRWQHDGRLLFGLRDDAGLYGVPTGAPGLLAVNADGSDLRMLVRRNEPFVTDGSQRSARTLSWNHSVLRTSVSTEAERRNEILLVEHSSDGRGTAVPVWLDTVTQRTRRVDLSGTPSPVQQWLTDSQGELRLAVGYEEMKMTVHWRPPGATAWRKLYEADSRRVPFTPHSLDDDGTLYVTQRDAQGYSVLKRFNLEAGKPDDAAVASSPGFDFDGTLLRGRDETLLGVRLETDAETTVWLHPAMKALQQKVDGWLPGRVNRINCRRCGEPDMTALVRSYSDQEPGRLYVYQPATASEAERLRSVGAVLSSVKPAEMGEMGFERIQARDGLELPVWITTPPGYKPGGPNAAPLPTIVMVHGGPWVRGHRWRWDPTAQFLASRGYLVIQPEFRGSTGYGVKHFRAGFKQWGRAMQDDVADALLWAQKKGLASDKACIAGASYGGYATLMGLVRHPELYRCGAAWLAVADLPLLLEGSWFVDDDTSNLSRQHTLPERIYDPKTERELVEANSPVHQADKIKAPVFLAFGASDRRVPLAHGKRLREALQKAGNEPEWVVYDGEGHGWRQQATRLDFAARLERFFAQHLQQP